MLMVNRDVIDINLYLGHASLQVVRYKCMCFNYMHTLDKTIIFFRYEIR